MKPWARGVDKLKVPILANRVLLFNGVRYAPGQPFPWKALGVQPAKVRRMLEYRSLKLGTLEALVAEEPQEPQEAQEAAQEPQEAAQEPQEAAQEPHREGNKSRSSVRSKNRKQ